MTVPPGPGAPFPTIGGFSTDPSRDAADPWNQTLRERMFDERVVLVCGVLEDSVGNEAALQLMALDANGDELVQLRLDCSDATLDAAFALVDVIDLLGVEVHAICTGQAIGPALGVVAVADKRLATPHSRFRLSQPHVAFRGRPRDIEAYMEEHRDRLARFCQRLASATHQQVATIEADMRAGRFLSAEEAKDYGLIDEITRPEAQILRFPRPFGFRPS